METQKIINFLTESEVKVIQNNLIYIHSSSAIKILHYVIQNGSACPNEIADAYGISKSLASIALGKLSMVGLLTRKRIGINVYYSCVNPEGIKTILETALKL